MAPILICNNVAAIVYLWPVAGKNKIWFKQITAAFFMLVLLAVTIAQVSHTHTFPATAAKIKAGNPVKHLSANEANISSANCFICDYQLTKDADAAYFLPQEISNVSSYSFPCFLYSFTPTGISTFFETRGPPSFI